MPGTLAQAVREIKISRLNHLKGGAMPGTASYTIRLGYGE